MTALAELMPCGCFLEVLPRDIDRARVLRALDHDVLRARADGAERLLEKMRGVLAT